MMPLGKMYISPLVHVLLLAVAPPSTRAFTSPTSSSSARRLGSCKFTARNVVCFSADANESTQSTQHVSQRVIVVYVARFSPQRPNSSVVIGGGIQATSVAFHISQSKHLPDGSSVTILEAQKLANAASGKGGGFMARSWGDGSPTQTLHELAFDMYEELCPMLGVQSYRKLPVLSVSPGPTAKSRQDNKSKNPSISDIVPNWLDGSVGRLAPMGFGDDTAQVTPREVVERMIEFAAIDVVLGKCVGVDAEVKGEAKAVTGVKYVDKETGEERVLPASDVVVSAGPWSCNAEHWFDGAVSLPMDGVKSTSIVWRPPRDGSPVDATALFCGEDPRYNTHLECYPRPDGTIYLCGIGERAM